MNEEKKFRLRAFVKYLFIEPWTESISLPNFRTLNTVFLCFALLYRWKVGILISIILLVLLQLINEYKQGKYIYWYRSRKYKDYQEALKKVRDERKKKLGEKPIQTTIREIGEIGK
jgi:hypothetical protein